MRSFIWTMLELAAHTAAREVDDPRCHALGVVGIRNDQTIVRARNGHSTFKIPDAHAEARICKKLDVGATIFIARVRKSGEYGMSAPCKWCRSRLRAAKVKRVYYTTDEKNVFACWEP